MIEHGMRTVVQADQVININPGARHEGRSQVAAKTPKQVSQITESLTCTVYWQGSLTERLKEP